MQRLNLAGTLMCGDIPYIEFEIINDYCTKFIPLHSNHVNYPFGCNPDEFSNYKQNLVVFFYDRTTPPTRQGLKEDLEIMGMKYYDMSQLIKYQNRRSVSDPFWVKFN